MIDKIRHYVATFSDEELVSLFESFSQHEQDIGTLGKMVYQELSSRHPRRMREYEKTNMDLKAAILKE